MALYRCSLASWKRSSEIDMAITPQGHMLHLCFGHITTMFRQNATARAGGSLLSVVLRPDLLRGSLPSGGSTAEGGCSRPLRDQARSEALHAFYVEPVSPGRRSSLTECGRPHRRAVRRQVAESSLEHFFMHSPFFRHR